MKKYYLGLDIGTDSVGYAVTDEEYNILKFAGRPAWGTTIFDPVSENADRRTFRSARRRLDRRQQRVNLLQELFAKEIAKCDEGFFKRLAATALFREDAGEKYSLFNDSNYTDLDYYGEYPTIHHLIDDLMKSKEPHDVRLVYLACAWLVAHRGHFLSNIDKNKLGEIKNFEIVYNKFLSFFSDAGFEEPWECDDLDELSKILKEKGTVTEKNKKLTSLLFKTSKPTSEATDEFPYSRVAIVKLLSGGSCKLQDVFDNEEYADKGSVSLSMEDDKLGEVMANIGEDYSLIEILRTIYDWSVLVDVLGNASTISEAKVNIYDQHKKDLENLKYIIRKYKNDKYNEVFRTVGKEDNYPAYVYHTDEKKDGLKKKSKEDFSKYILGIVKDIVPDEKDKKIYEDMLSRLEKRDFMPKQKNTDNRVIPHQLYWYELNKILENAAEYLPFLNEKDENNLSVKDKIESVFLFRIPYFVGPLNKNSKYAWLVRKDEKIYPWNFDNVVDLDASEQEFIKKLINTCTYLPGEHVLPKDSLCYHRFTVLNEINNIRINGQKISVELKQNIYNELFLKYKKVTRKKILDYLLCNGYIKKGEEESLSGIDVTINSNLAPQLSFKRLMENGTLSESDVEKIIERASYAEDKKRLMYYLDKEYSSLSDEDKNYITSIKIKDFGRLSKKFLTEFEGVCKETGELMTIMSALWNTNDNLMELLSERYTFKENLEAYYKNYYAENRQSLSDRLEDMYISNAVKRPIYRTLDVVKDVVKAFGKPEKIFIEVTRSASNELKGKRTKSRKQQILELYSKCKDEDVKILQKQLEEMGEYADNKLQSDKLFLYYTQFGKCMYTGTPIILEKLSSKEYDIDHIYPQAFVKDDSILNNKVLVLSSANGEKSNIYPIKEDIRKNMEPFWKHLKTANCITEEKYKRLTRRTPFTEDEKRGFINRQLVETSQSTKAVATLLGEKYPDAEIVYSKAGLVSDFRHEYDILKSRLFNDLHHAVDAYLNIVVGNVYNTKFSKRWFDINSNYSIKTKTIFSKPVVVGGKTIWDGESMLTKVKANAVKNNAHFTKYAFFKTGGLFDQMPVPASEGLVPRKKDLPTEKYGGYNKSSVMFFIPVKYTCGKKTDIMIMSVELAHGQHFLDDYEFAKEYSNYRLKKILGKEVTKIVFPIGKRPLKVNTVISFDGFRMCITASGGGGKCLSMQPMIQFNEDKYWQFYVKKLERLVEKQKSNSKYIYSEEYDYINQNDNIKLFDIFYDKMINSIYKLRPNLPIKALEDGREIFTNKTEIDQAKCLINILSVFGRMTGGCDLTIIKGKPTAASTVNFSSMVSNWIKKYKTAYIVDSSVTGFWEKKSENLIELL